VDLFTDGDASADAGYQIAEENAMGPKTKEKMDRIAFAGAMLAIGGYLVWFFTTLP
jgi:hypothetical protein